MNGRFSGVGRSALGCAAFPHEPAPPREPAPRANPLPISASHARRLPAFGGIGFAAKASRLVKCCLLEGLALEERQIGTKRHQVDRARFRQLSRKARKPEFSLRKPHSDIRPRRHAFWAKPFLGCGQTYVNGVQRRRDVLPKRTGPWQGSC